MDLNIGSLYGALINFAVNPDISTATYYIDDDTESDPTLLVNRVPLYFEFLLENSSRRPFLQADFAYQTLKADNSVFALSEGESISTKWSTIGGSVSAGIKFSVGDGFTLMPAITTGIFRIENEADYTGFLSTAILKPVFDGLVFNWDADAWLIEANLGAESVHKLQDLDLRLHGSLAHNYVESFQSSSGLIEFSSQVTTLDVDFETIAPTRLSILNMPLAFVMTIGNTGFLGANNDALDFKYFFEAGFAFESDMSHKNWTVQTLRLGGKAIVGDDVRGWSVLFGYRF